MAGLYIKEMKLRQAIERILILVPAPLTIQLQDELLRFFGETFQIIYAGNDQQQLINLWQRENQVIASLDYAKQPEVREPVWQQSWDLVIIDEAHKCSAYTKRRTGRADDVEKTKRYQLAERLTALADHVILSTATPTTATTAMASRPVRFATASSAWGSVRLRMRMTRQQLYASFNAIGNLADKAGAIRVTIEAEKLDGFDPNWLRNAVLEPLDEADVEVEE